MEVCGHFCPLANLHYEEIHCAHGIGGWVGPREHQFAVDKIKVCEPARIKTVDILHLV
jgi:hypothetical protein